MMLIFASGLPSQLLFFLAYALYLVCILRAYTGWWGAVCPRKTGPPCGSQPQTPWCGLTPTDKEAGGARSSSSYQPGGMTEGTLISASRPLPMWVAGHRWTCGGLGDTLDPRSCVFSPREAEAEVRRAPTCSHLLGGSVHISLSVSLWVRLSECVPPCLPVFVSVSLHHSPRLSLLVLF